MTHRVPAVVVVPLGPVAAVVVPLGPVAAVVVPLDPVAAVAAVSFRFYFEWFPWIRLSLKLSCLCALLTLLLIVALAGTASVPVRLPRLHRPRLQIPEGAVEEGALGNREVVAVVVLTWLSPLKAYRDVAAVGITVACDKSIQLVRNPSRPDALGLSNEHYGRDIAPSIICSRHSRCWKEFSSYRIPEMG